MPAPYEANASPMGNPGSITVLDKRKGWGGHVDKPGKFN